MQLLSVQGGVDFRLSTGVLESSMPPCAAGYWVVLFQSPDAPLLKPKNQMDLHRRPSLPGKRVGLVVIAQDLSHKLQFVVDCPGQRLSTSPPLCEVANRRFSVVQSQFCHSTTSIIF
jgi:hypothetical protein